MHSVPMPTAFVRLLKTLIVALLPLVLIITSVRLLVTDQYLAFEYGKAGFPPDPFGWDRPQRLAYAAANFRHGSKKQKVRLTLSVPSPAK